MVAPNLVLMNGSKKLSKNGTSLFLLFMICVISISLNQIAHAQTSSVSESQITLSENLHNDPIAQDILKKIEQTKKMIDELRQKEFEENQARENLKKMRDISVERLNQNLAEWERMWEQHSSRNSFEKFVNKKPSYVQGVFWDQFEFKEQKVNAGRIAMNKVLTDGGTMHDAKEAYNEAATTLRVELIEMNSQLNVKHNLADPIEQKLFNSAGQVHQSPAIHTKLTDLYSDYKTQPGYILANMDDANTLDLNFDSDSNLNCVEGFVLVSRITTGHQSCVEQSTAEKWMKSGIKGLVIAGANLPDKNKIEINPATQCGDEFQVIYHIAKAEYQCVSEHDATFMLEQSIAESHTLVDYIGIKDEQKTYEDIVYDINQRILAINEEFDIKNRQLESKYDEIIDNHESTNREKMLEDIEDYKVGIISKEEVNKHISKIRDTSDALRIQILEEKAKDAAMLESEKRHRMLDVIKGHDNNPDLDVDWDHLNSTDSSVQVSSEEEETVYQPVIITISDKDDKVILDKINVVNSFGHRFDEIKSEQVLQIAADITNSSKHEQDFAYVVEITDDQNNPVQPAKWATGTLNPVQTFNVSLSWIPEDAGEYKASVFVGTDINSVLQAADIEINVNSDGDVSDEDYCKNDSELLFKYSDNSPICVASDTAFKLINKGLAFA